MLNQIKEYGILEWILRIFTIFLSTFAEAKSIFHAVLFLILVDQITGIVKVCILRTFKWRIFNRVYRKVLLYMLVIMATYVFEKYLIQTGSIFFTKGIAALIGFQELASSYLNVAKITNIKMFSTIINKFR